MCYVELHKGNDWLRNIKENTSRHWSQSGKRIEMNRSIGLLFFVLTVLIYSVENTSNNETFARLEAMVLPQFVTSRQKALGDLVMSPSKNREQVRLRLRSIHSLLINYLANLSVADQEKLQTSRDELPFCRGVLHFPMPAAFQWMRLLETHFNFIYFFK